MVSVMVEVPLLLRIPAEPVNLLTYNVSAARPEHRPVVDIVVVVVIVTAVIVVVVVVAVVVVRAHIPLLVVPSVAARQQIGRLAWQILPDEMQLRQRLLDLVPLGFACCCGLVVDADGYQTYYNQHAKAHTLAYPTSAHIW